MAIRLPGPESVGSVGIARDPGSRAHPDDFGAQIGRAQQEFAGAVAVVGQIGQRLARERQDATDKVFADTFDLEYSAAAQKEYMDAQTGANLDGSGFAQDVDRRLESLSESTLNNLRERGFNPSQRAMAAIQGAALRNRADYLVKAETWAHNRNVTMLGEQLDKNAAAVSASVLETGDLDGALDRIDQTLENYGGVLPAEAIADKRREYREQTVDAHIAALQQAGLYDEAAAVVGRFYGADPRRIVRPASLTPQIRERGNAAMSRLMSGGLTKEQAAGVVGNLVQESGLNTTAAGDGGTSHGIAQWRGERLENLKQYASEKGADWQDFNTQIDFILHELKTDEKAAWEALQNAGTAEQAAAAFIGYERPKGWTASDPRGGHGWENRAGHALAFAGEEPSEAPGEDGPEMADAGKALKWYANIENNQQKRETEDYSNLLGGLEREIYENQDFGKDDLGAYGLDDDDHVRLAKQIDARDKELEDQRLGIAALQAGQKLNPYDAKSRTVIDEGYIGLGGPAGLLDGDEAAQQRLGFVVQRSGVVPASAVRTLRAGLIQQDPATVASAMQIAAQVDALAPHAMKAVDGGSSVSDAAEWFRHWTNDRGVSAEEAARRWIEKEQAGPERKARQDLARDLAGDLKVDEVLDQYDTWMPLDRPDVDSAGLQASMIGDYRSFFEERFVETGDEESAKAMALADMKKIYGVTNVLGRRTLMRFPPETTYPPIGGSHDYFREQLVEEVSEVAGRELSDDEIALSSIPQTGAAISAGRPAPYGVMYVEEIDGQKVWQALPGLAFVADTDRAAQEHDEKRRAEEKIIQHVDDVMREVDGDVPRGTGFDLVDPFLSNPKIPALPAAPSGGGDSDKPEPSLGDMVIP